jgi:hypothetical protein
MKPRENELVPRMLRSALAEDALRRVRDTVENYSSGSVVNNSG